MDITIKILKVQDGDRTRYDIQAGDSIYHFWTLEAIEEFANTESHKDTEHRKHIKAIVKEELKTKTVEEFINIQEPERFITNKPVADISVEKQNG